MEFNTEAEAILYKQLRDKNKTVGFDTEEEAKQYQDLKNRATGVSKPKESFTGRLLKSIVGTGMEIGKNVVGDIANLPQVGEKLVGDIAQKGPLQVGSEMVRPVIGPLMQGLFPAPTAASPELQEYATKGTEEIKGLAKAYTTELPKTFTEHPLYTTAVITPILKGLYKSSPVFKAAGESLAEGVKGAGKMVKEHTPLVSKPLQTRANIRVPSVTINPKIRKEYWNKKISLSEDYGKVVDGVTDANPTRTAPLQETAKYIKDNYANDPILKSIVDKNPTLKGIVEGTIDEKTQFTLRQLNDIKNAFKNKVQQSKLNGNYRGDYLGVMDVVESLQQDIVNPFPEMAEQNAIYGRGVRDFRLIKALGQEGKTGAGIDALATGPNASDMQLIANRYFADNPKLLDEIRRYSRGKNVLKKFHLQNFPFIGEKNILGKKKYIPGPPKG